MRTPRVRSALPFTLVMLVTSYLYAGAPTKTRKTRVSVGRGAQTVSSVPFDSFRFIDQKLSLLDVQVNQVDALVQKTSSGAIATSSGKRARQPWVRPSQQVLNTIRLLDRRAANLQRHYKRSTAGKKIFPALIKAAAGLKESALRLNGARDSTQARTALDAVRQSRIDFALSFQALSADYGALRCERGRWACCDVAQQNHTAECRWSCVATPRRCSKGLLGPRSRSASANVIRH